MDVDLRKRVRPILQMSVAQFDAAFPDELACVRFLVERRWPRGVRCPRCGGKNVYPLRNMEFKWECPDCRNGGAYRFSHLVGTIFENTNLELLDWFRVIYLIVTRRRGIKVRTLQHLMGFGSYKTAWSLRKRVLTALRDPAFRKLLNVE